jgi:hypothetical protein
VEMTEDRRPTIDEQVASQEHSVSPMHLDVEEKDDSDLEMEIDNRNAHDSVPKELIAPLSGRNPRRFVLLSPNGILAMRRNAKSQRGDVVMQGTDPITAKQGRLARRRRPEVKGGEAMQGIANGL